MPSGRYINGVSEIGAGNVSHIDDTISIALVTSDYTPDFDNDISQSDIPDSALIQEESLTGKSMNGVSFEASDCVFRNVTAGLTITAIVVFKDAVAKSATVLLAYLDDSLNLPIVTDGTDLTISFINGKVYDL